MSFSIYSLFVVSLNPVIGAVLSLKNLAELVRLSHGCCSEYSLSKALIKLTASGLSSNPPFNASLWPLINSNILSLVFLIPE